MKVCKKLALGLVLASVSTMVTPFIVHAETHVSAGLGYNGVGYYRGMEYVRGYYGGRAFVLGAFSKHIDHPTKSYKVVNEAKALGDVQEQMAQLEHIPYYYIGKSKEGNVILSSDGQPVMGPKKELHIGRLDSAGKLDIVLYEDAGKTVLESVNTGSSIVMPTKHVEVTPSGLIYVMKGESTTYFNLAGQMLHSKPFKLDKELYGDLHSVGTTNKLVAIFNARTGEYKSDEIFTSLSWNQNTGLISGYQTDGSISYFDEEGKHIDTAFALKIISQIDGEPPYIVSMPQQVEGQRIQRVLAPFSEGIAFVLLGNKQKVAIDESGKILFSVKEYDEIEPYLNGIARVTRKAHGLNFGGIFNTLAAALVKGAFYHQATYGETDYAWTTSKLKRGYIDKTGKEVISSKNQMVSPLTEAGIMTYKDGRFGLYTKEGVEVFPMVYKNITYMPELGAFLLQDEAGRWGVKKQDNTTVLPFAYSKLEVLAPTVLVGKSGSSYRMISLDTFREIGESYDSISAPKPFHGIYSGLIGKRGQDAYLVNPLTGESILHLPLETSKVDTATLESVVYKQRGKYGVLDFTGNTIVEPKYESIQVFVGKSN